MDWWSTVLERVTTIHYRCSIFFLDHKVCLVEFLLLRSVSPVGCHFTYWQWLTFTQTFKHSTQLSSQILNQSVLYLLSNLSTVGMPTDGWYCPSLTSNEYPFGTQCLSNSVYHSARKDLPSPGLKCVACQILFHKINFMCWVKPLQHFKVFNTLGCTAKQMAHGTRVRMTWHVPHTG